MLKSLPKIIVIFFLTVFILQLACLLFLTLAPNISQAADPATFKPQIQIPGMAEEFGATDKTGGYAIPGSTASIAKYIKVIYKYAIGIVGILAAVVLMVGGVMWIVAGGSSTMIGEAKSWIGASLTGLTIALLSYLILATINPALVDLKTTPIQQVQSTATADDNVAGCCNFKDQGGTIQLNFSRCEYKTYGECKNASGFYSFIKSTQCYNVSGCPQYGSASSLKQCSNKPDGITCNVNDDPNTPGKCKNNECVQCIKSGGECSGYVFGNDECCSNDCLFGNKCK
ncbi:MAG: hypothetical protein PHF50_01425 [Patescibacteria group bacterium]|nr:hypothetical protein [Patescibacteria group bacterium]